MAACLLRVTHATRFSEPIYIMQVICRAAVSPFELQQLKKTHKL